MFKNVFLNLIICAGICAHPFREIFPTSTSPLNRIPIMSQGQRQSQYQIVTPLVSASASPQTINILPQQNQAGLFDFSKFSLGQAQYQIVTTPLGPESSPTLNILPQHNQAGLFDFFKLGQRQPQYQIVTTPIRPVTPQMLNILPQQNQAGLFDFSQLNLPIQLSNKEQFGYTFPNTVSALLQPQSTIDPQILQLPYTFQIQNPLQLSLTQGPSELQIQQITGQQSIPSSYIDSSTPTVSILRPPSAPEIITEIHTGQVPGLGTVVASPDGFKQFLYSVEPKRTTSANALTTSPTVSFVHAPLAADQTGTQTVQLPSGGASVATTASGLNQLYHFVDPTKIITTRTATSPSASASLPSTAAAETVTTNTQTVQALPSVKAVAAGDSLKQVYDPKNTITTETFTSNPAMSLLRPSPAAAKTVTTETQSVQGSSLGTTEATANGFNKFYYSVDPTKTITTKTVTANPTVSVLQSPSAGAETVTKIQTLQVPSFEASSVGAADAVKQYYYSVDPTKITTTKTITTNPTMSILGQTQTVGEALTKLQTMQIPSAEAVGLDGLKQFYYTVDPSLTTTTQDHIVGGGRSQQHSESSEPTSSPEDKARYEFPYTYSVLPYSSSIVPGVTTDLASPFTLTDENNESRRTRKKNPYFNVNKRKHFEFYQYF